jgi:LemA protein
LTYALILLVVVIAGWLIATYNRLVGLQRRADSAWADIDAQLKRRHDLVPSLVEVVKGYASHERSTLEEVVRRRGEATEAGGQPNAETAARENMLAGALRQMFALSEAYPQLLANERFAHLQQQLSDIEQHLQSARRYYNAVVRDLNTAQQSFPAVVVARGFGFGHRPFFEIEDASEREAVRVSLDA